MACFNLHRAARLLACGLCLLLGTLQFTLAQDGSFYNDLENSDKATPQVPQAGDVQLRRTYMALVSMFSDASRAAADRYGCSELRMLSNDLDSHIRTVNDNTEKPGRLELKKRAVPEEADDAGDKERESILAMLFSDLASASTDDAGETESTTSQPTAAKRGLFDGIGKLFGGGGAGADAVADGPITQGLGKAMGGILTKLLSTTGSGLAGAGFFGGVGIGEGAAQGLKLSPASKTKTLAAQVAQENGMTSSGLNPVIQSAAMGLTATALRAVTDSGVLKALNLPSLADAADALGTGLGNGGAIGLGLTKNAATTTTTPPATAALNSSGLVGGIGALGFGASRALTSNLNLSALLPAGMDIGRIALTAGQGIGAGTAGGLKLTTADTAPPPPASNADIPGIAGTFAFGLSKALAGSLNVSAQGLGTLLPAVDLASAALRVGDGIGSGAALGLKLTQNDTSGLGTPAPAVVGAGPIDVSRIAGTLAFGVSKSLTGSLNASGVSLSSLIPANVDVAGIILGAGRGIGSGASSGLGLSDLAGRFTNLTSSLIGRADPAAAPAGAGATASNPLADVAGLVERFSFGLSNAFTDGINLTAQAAKLVGGLGSVDLGATVAGVGSGVGLGIAKGLDLGSSKAVAPPPKPTSLKELPELAATFAFGLSDALTGGLNISGLTQSLTSSAGGLLARFAAPVASGLGKGIGVGAAVGLGLQPESVITDAAASTAGLFDVEGLSENFAASLTSGLLANNTVGGLLGGVLGGGGNGTGGGGGGLGGLLGNVDVPRVANGLARGLLTGAGDGVQAMGGIDAIIKGTAVPPEGEIPETKIVFNDSTNGAAIGLGQGLGTSGVVTLQRLLAKRLGASSPPQRRDLAVFERRQEKGAEDGAAAPLDLSRLVDPSAVSTVAQKGIDVLTCDGVAGLVLIVLGLQKSGTVSLGTPSAGTTLDTLKSLIPKGIIEVESKGNTFSIDGAKLADKLGQSSLLSLASTLSINGRPVVTYAVLLALHIVIAVLALFIIWPLVLTFDSMQTLAPRFRIPVLVTRRTTKLSRILRLFVLPPSLLAILIFGVLSGAAKGHFRTAHGILSLFTLIFAIAAIVLASITRPSRVVSGVPTSLTAKPKLLTWASQACNQILLALLFPTVTTGFTDLNSVTLCLARAVVTIELAVGFGMGLVFLFMLGQYASSLEGLLLMIGNRTPRTSMMVKVEESPAEVVYGVDIGPPVLPGVNPVDFKGMENTESIPGEEPKNFI